jgi:hypothetical protein
VVLVVQAMAHAGAPATLAVIGGETSGWGDLLMARLSASDAVTLVERDRLGAVFAERTVDGLLASRTDRSRIGDVVGADFLVLVTEDAAHVRLVVCDSRLGVTLQDLSLFTTDRSRDDILAALADQTMGIVEAFAGGVRHVVAVPDFVSRDLTFEFSALQSDYAEVLRAAYRGIPGLALVAVDEAKSIAVERDVAAVADVAQTQRHVPMFIEGEYRTTRDPESGQVSVRITVRARDMTKALVQRELEAVSLDQAGCRLLTVFTTDLAGLTSAGGPAIDADGQYGLLIERADEFGALGDFRRSAALREAALLLRPDADAQRSQLVREYTRRNTRPVQFGGWPDGARQGAGDPFWTAVVARVVGDWNRSLCHCEYLVRNRRLCREEATDLSANALHSITGVRTVYSGPLDACEAVKKEFLREVFARIATLDPAAKVGRHGLTGSLDVYHALFDSALMRCDGNYYKGEDLDLIADLLLTRLPDSMWPSYRLTFFLSDAGTRTGRETGHTYYRFTGEEYEAFLNRLTASDRPLVRIYGRYGTLCLRRYGKQETSQELLQEARSIVADAQKAGFGPRQYDYFMGQLRDQAAWLARDLAPTDPATMTPSLRPAALPPAPPTSRVSLDPIELAVVGTGQAGEKLSPEMRWRSPGGWGGVSRFRPMGNGLDAFWAAGAVLFMRSPGELTPVLADERLRVDDVVSDGRYVWVAASCAWGLSVLDWDGRELIRVGTDNGLPPCDCFGMVVYPLNPGRVLASGSFDEGQRAWIASVGFDGATATVDVILEATKVWDYRNKDNPTNTDPAMTFTPQAMFEHVTPGPPPRRTVFILRRYNPLLVDPETRKVWVYPVTDWSRQCFPRLDPPGDAFLSIDGVLWIAGAGSDFQSYRLDENTGLFEVVRNRPDWHIGNERAGRLVRDGDWLIYAGGKWRRLNLRTGEEEVLVDNPRALPHYGRDGAWHIAHSTHYGLVAFYEGSLYRVRIDGE